LKQRLEEKGLFESKQFDALSRKCRDLQGELNHLKKFRENVGIKSLQQKLYGLLLAHEKLMFDFHHLQNAYMSVNHNRESVTNERNYLLMEKQKLQSIVIQLQNEVSFSKLHLFS
jgi:hypothetical protein